MSDEREPFSEWAILELMGHRRLAGLVTEETIAGQAFLRLDVPNGCTGVTAVWCPVHGRCKCPDEVPDDDVGCPLHTPLHAPLPHDPAIVATQFYSPSAVYCLTTTTQENAERIAAGARPQPATRWELRAGDEDDFS